MEGVVPMPEHRKLLLMFAQSAKDLLEATYKKFCLNNER